MGGAHGGVPLLSQPLRAHAGSRKPSLWNAHTSGSTAHSLPSARVVMLTGLSMRDSGGITIRPWEARDREDVQRLLRLLSEDASVVGQDAPTYVAQRGTQVVGMVTLCVFRTLTGSKAYLDHLVVAPDWRRRGIGRALVHDAIMRAGAAGASRIDLTAGGQKHAGRALYESLGFRRRDTGSFRLHIADPSTNRPAPS